MALKTYHNKVHFLTGYVEYLLDQGIQSEEYYLGDASRFIRYLLANSTEDDVRRFIEQSAVSAYYRKRLEKTLRKFFAFCGERLAIECPQKQKNQTQALTQDRKRVCLVLCIVVGATRFERATFASRTRRSTKLSHAPQLLVYTRGEEFVNLERIPLHGNSQKQKETD